MIGKLVGIRAGVWININAAPLADPHPAFAAIKLLLFAVLHLSSFDAAKRKVIHVVYFTLVFQSATINAGVSAPGKQLAVFILYNLHF